jgi:hypothetical protein
VSFILALMLAGAGYAQQPLPDEYDIKAAYVYNFGRFARWPDTLEDEGTFAICIVGTDFMGPTLDAILSGEEIDGLPLVLRRLSSASDSVDTCRILFISRSEESRLDRILGIVGTLPILTVSDVPGFARRGGMIEFVLDDNRVRFEIDADRVDRNGLALASELLRVASAVHSINLGGQ